MNEVPISFQCEDCETKWIAYGTWTQDDDGHWVATIDPLGTPTCPCCDGVNYTY